MTFSIVGFDPVDGSLGLASQSHFFGVGSVVGSAEAGVGAVVSQAFANTDWSHLALQMLRDGATPAVVVRDLVNADPQREYRQLVVMDSAGEHASHTGSRCVPSTSSATGTFVVAAGNMLASDSVSLEMIKAYRGAGPALTDKLVAALAAGEGAGGDARGSQSACVKVVSGQRSDRPWKQVLLDLRVDDHPDPVRELQRILPIHGGFGAVGAALFGPPLVIGDAGAIDPTAAAAAVARLEEAAPSLGTNREADLWRSVILIRSGQVETGTQLLNELIDERPALRGFADGLVDVGILPDLRPSSA
jgi:uncharacterized Ntn-hydrolase superfamily protein